MPEPWLKIEHSLPDKAEVIAMAAALGIDQDAVAGKCLRVWAWWSENADRRGDGQECNALPVTKSFLDRHTACPGFATAMMTVGWLVGVDGALAIPNFDRHNGTTAKSRASTARRVGAHRERAKDVTPKTLQHPLPDKDKDEEGEPIVNLNDSRKLLPGLTGAPNGPETFQVDPPEDFDAGQRDLWRQLCVEMGHGCKKSRLGFIQYRHLWAKHIRENPFAVYEGIAAHHLKRDDGRPSTYPGKLIHHIMKQHQQQRRRTA